MFEPFGEFLVALEAAVIDAPGPAGVLHRIVSSTLRAEQPEVLLEVPKATSDAGELLVFTTGRDGPLTKGTFSKGWLKAVKAAGLPAGTGFFHGLRHYYASLLIAKGASVKVV